MGDTIENEAIAEALAVIDRSLETLHARNMMTSSEVSDLLLDVRLLISGSLEGLSGALEETASATN
jgi:hypothetical protein